MSNLKPFSAASPTWIFQNSTFYLKSRHVCEEG
jgi:hypothetical protein